MSETVSCGHADEEDISTFGDLGRGVRTLICVRCGRECELPYDWKAHFGYPGPRREGATL